MNRKATGKLIYVFVAGVEGVGHHGLHPVLETAYRLSAAVRDSHGEVIAYKKRMKRGFNQIWCHVHPPGLGFFRPLFRRYLDYFFSKEKARALSSGQVRVIIEDNSFPAGRYRDMSRQWKLDEMHEIVSRHADEIYYIGLYRDPIAAVFSHQGFDGGPDAHAEKIQTALKYLNAELGKLAPEQLRIVHYEDLIGNQMALGAMLAEFLHLDEAALKEGFGKVRASKKEWRRDMPEAEQLKMKAIFSQENAEEFWPRFLTPSRAEKQ
ncbi:MAG TPA: hypothetical protein VGE00_00840 [Gammaproteobacteria bacterium]